MMNPMCSVTITLYFEIKNSEMYGGMGSVGYSSVALSDCKNPENADDAFILAQRKITAKLLGVSIEDVTVITKEAYDTATQDPDEDFGDDWDED